MMRALALLAFLVGACGVPEPEPLYCYPDGGRTRLGSDFAVGAGVDCVPPGDRVGLIGLIGETIDPAARADGGAR